MDSLDPGALDLSRFRVLDDADDDPVLLNADGTAIDTWREGYPYDERLDRDEYDRASVSCRSSC